VHGRWSLISGQPRSVEQTGRVYSLLKLRAPGAFLASGLRATLKGGRHACDAKAVWSPMLSQGLTITHLGSNALNIASLV
jgi:hypothetical protein